MKEIFKNYSWFIFALLLSLIVFLIWFSSLTETELTILFSSDTLYLPSLYRDLFQDGYTLNGWTFNAAPNFFPDMLLFFSLNAITGSFISAAFFYALIQYFSILILFYALFKQIKPNLHPSTFALAIIFFTSFLFIFLIDNDFYISSLINNNAFHNSAFLITVLLLWLVFLFLRKKSNKILIVMGIITIIAAPCDRLFFVCFSVPVFLMAVVLYFLNFEKQLQKRFFIMLLLSTIVAIIVWLIFKNNSVFRITSAYGEMTIKSIVSSWQIFSQQMISYLTTFSIRQILICLSLISYLTCVMFVVYKLIKVKNKKESLTVIVAFEVFVLFFTPIVLFAPILSGSYGGFDTFRYNYFPFLLLPFNIILLMSDFLDKNKMYRILFNAVFCSLVVLFSGYYLRHHTIVKELSNFFSFCPAYVIEIDSYFQDTTITQHGICNDYWKAKQITMFTKKNIRVYFTFDDGFPWHHAANINWFYNADDKKRAPSIFTFLFWQTTTQLPDFFKENNPDVRAVVLRDMNLYKVSPYCFESVSYSPMLVYESTQRQE
jgi:hypothetical protein